MKNGAALALDARALEVLLTQLAALRGTQIRQRLGVGGLSFFARAALEGARDRHQVGQFHSPFDCRVARQNLLQQRRAGARQADDENRIGRLCAKARALREEGMIEQRPGTAHQLAQLVGFIGHLGAAPPIALRVVFNRCGIVAGVLQRFAERELEKAPILIRQIRASELRSDAVKVGGLKLEGLQVRQAPVGLAHRRGEFQSSTVRRHALWLPAGSLQGVSVADPDPGLMRVLGQQARVDSDRLVIFADRAQHCGLEVSMARIARVLRQQPVDLTQRRRRLGLAMQDQRVILPCSREPRGQFQRSGQQHFGVPVSAEAGGNLRKHSDRRHVGRKALQVVAQ